MAFDCGADGSLDREADCWLEDAGAALADSLVPVVRCSSHQTVTPTTRTPIPTKTPRKAPSLFVTGTGTASLGNCDSNTTGGTKSSRSCTTSSRGGMTGSGIVAIAGAMSDGGADGRGDGGVTGGATLIGAARNVDPDARDGGAVGDGPIWRTAGTALSGSDFASSASAVISS